MSKTTAVEVVDNGSAVIRVIGIAEDPEIWRHITECFSGIPAFSLLWGPKSAEELAILGMRWGQAVVLAEPKSLGHSLVRTIRPLLLNGTIRLLALIREEEEGESLLRAGYIGIIAGNSPCHLFHKAVQAVAAGEIWASRKVMSRLLRDRFALEGAQTLTPREVKILALLCEGNSNRAIAEKLYISKETVRWHLRSLYSKLGASGRHAAIRIAISGGWTGNSQGLKY